MVTSEFYYEKCMEENGLMRYCNRYGEHDCQMTCNYVKEQQEKGLVELIKSK